MDVGVSTSLSRVDGLNGDGVGDSNGDRDGKEGERGGWFNPMRSGRCSQWSRRGRSNRRLEL